MGLTGRSLEKVLEVVETGRCSRADGAAASDSLKVGLAADANRMRAGCCFHTVRLPAPYAATRAQRRDQGRGPSACPLLHVGTCPGQPSFGFTLASGLA